MTESGVQSSQTWKTPGTAMHEIIPQKLYLGSLFSAQNKELLMSHKITHIIMAAEPLLAKFPNDFKYMKIPAQDEENFNIAQYFQESHSFIDEAFEEGGVVLVHCIAGQSRSASIVISFLMNSNNMSFSEAFQYVKDRREFINPNPGFKKQLQNYGEKLNTEKNSN